MRSRRSHQLLQVVVHAERESGAGFAGVSQIERMYEWQLEKWQETPGEKAVGRVPRIGARRLRTQDGIIDIEIENLVGTGARPHVRAHHHVALAEAATQAELKGVVMVLARVLQKEIATRLAIDGVVNEAMGLSFLQELRF